MCQAASGNILYVIILYVVVTFLLLLPNLICNIMYMNKKTWVALAFSFVIALSIQNCEANKREMLKKVFGFLDFDARDVKEPSAIAPRAPVVVVPQYRSANPIYLQPLTNPVPEVMLGGVSPYSNLDSSGKNNPELWRYSNLYPEHQ